MSSLWIWVLVFLVAALSLGFLFGVGALLDVLEYRDVQRRLRDERERRHAR